MPAMEDRSLPDKGANMFDSNTVIDMELTGINLRRHAAMYGYSVKDLQQYLGLACPQPVYRWFRGSILPSVDHLLRLSELFHVHMEDLLVTGKKQVYCERYTIDRYMDTESFIQRMQAYSSTLAA